MPAVLKVHSALSTTSGVATPVSNSSVLCSSVIFEADASNTGKVYFGDSTVTTSTGQSLSAGQKFTVSFDNQYGNNNIFDLSNFYFATDTTSNVVRVLYIKWVTPNAL